jgi:hypothetical protein
MCARRFLGCIFILTLIVVGGAFAFYQWGGEALVRMATPVGHYQAPPKGSGPDYSKADTWLARPDLAGNRAAWVPQGDIASKPDSQAATFYIHPTTYLERDRWNAPLNLAGQSADRSQLFVQSQASAFGSSGWASFVPAVAVGARPDSLALTVRGSADSAFFVALVSC